VRVALWYPPDSRVRVTPSRRLPAPLRGDAVADRGGGVDPYVGQGDGAAVAGEGAGGVHVGGGCRGALPAQPVAQQRLQTATTEDDVATAVAEDAVAERIAHFVDVGSWTRTTRVWPPTTSAP
jgi:hypothetical protein